MIYYISGLNVVDNDGGTIKANGSNNNDKFNQTTTSRKDSGVFGSTVVDGTDTDPALALGVFAYNNSKPVGKKVTNKINTITNNVLLSGALVPGLIQSVKKSRVCTGGTCSDGVRTRRSTLAIRTNKFNIYTGKFDSGFPVVAADAFATDKEANVNRNNNGALVYFIGSSPVEKNYPVKTG